MRQYISAEQPDRKGLLSVTGKDFRYLRRSLRIRSGDMIDVRLPDGRLVPMTVCRIDDVSGSVVMQICTLHADASDGTVTRGVSAGEVERTAFFVEYTLFQFIAKPQKMELIIRQAVECGIKNIVPVAGTYSQKGSITAMQEKAAGTERIRRIIREAREQSGSPVATTVFEPVTAAEAASLWKKECSTLAQNEFAGVLLSERSDLCVPLKDVIALCTHIKKAAVVVGCEGGVSPEEVGILMNSGFVPVHFACNILRCETAALYGIAALQSAVFALQKQ
jgi:16S rRNA (uracil1498-N3)-methyltransferase